VWNKGVLNRFWGSPKNKYKGKGKKTRLPGIIMIMFIGIEDVQGTMIACCAVRTINIILCAKIFQSSGGREQGSCQCYQPTPQNKTNQAKTWVEIMPALECLVAPYI